MILIDSFCKFNIDFDILLQYPNSIFKRKYHHNVSCTHSTVYTLTYCTIDMVKYSSSAYILFIIIKLKIIKAKNKKKYIPVIFRQLFQKMSVFIRPPDCPLIVTQSNPTESCQFPCHITHWT